MSNPLAPTHRAIEASQSPYSIPKPDQAIEYFVVAISATTLVAAEIWTVAIAAVWSVSILLGVSWPFIAALSLMVGLPAIWATYKTTVLAFSGDQNGEQQDEAI